MKCPNCGASYNEGEILPWYIKTYRFIKRKVITEMRWENFWEGIGNFIWAIMGLAIFSIIFVLGYKWITSPGFVEYCYIESEDISISPDRYKKMEDTIIKGSSEPTPVSSTEKLMLKHCNGCSEYYLMGYELKGARKWTNDLNIGKYETMDEAKLAAEKINCKIGAK